MELITSSKNIKVEKPIEEVEEELSRAGNLSIPISNRRKRHIKVEYEVEESAIVPKKKKSSKRTKLEEWTRPTEEETRDAHKLLCETYGKPYRASSDSKNACGKKEDILFACIAVILSQNTSDTNSGRAFASLKKVYPDLEEMRKAPIENIEEAIKCGGLSKIKSKRIHDLLESVYQDFGVTSLESLRNRTTEEIKSSLSKYKGVGPKTVSCVLMFTLGRDDFPVDTHVHRVSTRLGWVREDGGSREKSYEHLNAKIPDDIKYDLHVLIVRHGRAICQSQIPKCASCPINSICTYDQKTTTILKTIKAEKIRLRDLIE